MNISIYGHSGSQNHGNEAIVRGACKIFDDQKITVYSASPSVDIEYGLDEVCTVKPAGAPVSRYSVHNIPWALARRITGKPIFNHRPQFRSLLRNISGVYLLEAGDQYCENDEVRAYYAYVNRMLNRAGAKTVAYGCTILPEILKNPRVIDDLNQYSLIVARESLTYEALRQAGVRAETVLAPCAAFAMESRECELPALFMSGDVVGINAGPLAQGNEKYYDLLFRNYIRLIDYILRETKMGIALIPHVNWRGDFRMRDIRTLEPLYLQFKDSGRITLVEEQDAARQKYVMSKCRLMVALRTHVCVPSLASEVPTLIAGYKVKSAGIARDIFGDDKTCLLPVQELEKDDQLQNAFKNLLEQEPRIRRHLKETMPAYIAQTYGLRDRILSLM